MASVLIALALGGNIGDVPATFRQASEDLRQAGVNRLRLSSFYRTVAEGCAPGTPDFINAALTGEWSGSVGELHELCKNLEEKFGRPREHEHYASRTLDLDIIFFGDEIISTPELTIPHCEAATRLFVLVPLTEIAGDLMFPGRHERVRDILSRYKGTEAYREFYHKNQAFAQG